MAALTRAQVVEQQMQTVKSVICDPKVVAQLGKISRFLNAERLNRIAYTEIRQNPKLLECDPYSLLAGIMKAASLGLEIGNGLGHAYLVPYGREVTMIPGYRGYIHAALRTGIVKAVASYPVFIGDDFDYMLGLYPDVKHRPNGNKKPDDLTHAYAYAKMNGELLVDVMVREEIDAIRQRSKAKDSGPWVTDFTEMARKTVVRRLCKYLPMNEDLAELAKLDEQADQGKPQENWRMFDGYDMPAHAPEVSKNMANAEAADQNDAREKEDQQKAVKALNAMWDFVEQKLGGEPQKILGKTYDEVAALPSQQILACIEKLKTFKPSK